jgi:uncharacterized protein
VKIEATVVEIRALLELVEADRSPAERTSKAGGERRETAARQVPPRLLGLYQQLLDAGRNPPVVAIERGLCAGCHMRLPTMLENRARRSVAVHRCPHCRRMLYVPELMVKPGEAAAGGPGRSASTSRQTRS